MKLAEYMKESQQLHEQRLTLQHEIKTLKELLEEKEHQLKKITRTQQIMKQSIYANLSVEVGELVDSLARTYNATPVVSAEVILKKPIIMNKCKSSQTPTNPSWKIVKAKDYDGAKIRITIDLSKCIFPSNDKNTVFEFIRPFDASQALSPQFQRGEKSLIGRQLKNGINEYTGIKLISDIRHLSISFTMEDVEHTNNSPSSDYFTFNPIQKGLRQEVFNIIDNREISTPSK